MDTISGVPISATDLGMAMIGWGDDVCGRELLDMELGIPAFRPVFIPLGPPLLIVDAALAGPVTSALALVGINGRSMAWTLKPIVMGWSVSEAVSTSL